MLGRCSLGLYVLLFYVCISITLGSDSKGHTKHHLGNLSNSPERNQGQGEQAIPGRGGPGAGRGEAGQGQEEAGQGQEEGGRRREGGRGQEGGRGREEGGQGQEEGGQGQEEGGRRQEGGRGREEGGRGREEGGPGQEEGGRGQEEGGRGREEGGRGREEGGQGEDGSRGGERGEGKQEGSTGKHGGQCLCDCGQVPNRPHPSYELHQKFGYYKYHNHAKNWFAAKRECEKEGAHLAIINSPQERDLLLKIYKKLPLLVKNPAVFVGINDLEEEGKWVTVHNEAVSATGFKEWNINEPLGKTVQNCGALQAEVGKLHDHECHNLLGFICERELDYKRYCA